ncbi:MAG: cyclase family protein [Candidatus Omnitrophica bacterium]|nr:cyclase family protein [Candidatus Omnitrophota bacterium]
MRMVDLSLPIDDTAFEVHPLRIERTGHKEGIEKLNKVMMSRMPGGAERFKAGERIIRPSDVPGQEFLSLEMVYSSVHSGTHLDYSYHYGSRSEGRASKPASEIPLEWCAGPGVKLSLRDAQPGGAITADDLRAELDRIGYGLKPYDIVLISTGCDRLFGGSEYFSEYPGIDPGAIDFLLDSGIKIFGVDTMGIDRPYKYMMKEFLEEKNTQALWPAHFHGRKREFVHIERLANLAALPDYGFTVFCFPVKIRNTGGAWARVVARVQEQ